jgi:hypothetical protein
MRLQLVRNQENHPMPTNLPKHYRPKAPAPQPVAPPPIRITGGGVVALVILATFGGCVAMCASGVDEGPGTKASNCVPNGSGGCYWLDDTAYALYKTEQAEKVLLEEQAKANARTMAKEGEKARRNFEKAEAAFRGISAPAPAPKPKPDIYHYGKDQTRLESGKVITWE